MRRIRKRWRNLVVLDHTRVNMSTVRSSSKIVIPWPITHSRAQSTAQPNSQPKITEQPNTCDGRRRLAAVSEKPQSGEDIKNNFFNTCSSISLALFKTQSLRHKSILIPLHNQTKSNPIHSTFSSLFHSTKLPSPDPAKTLKKQSSTYI